MGNQYTKKENRGLGVDAVVVTFKATRKQVAKLKRDVRAAKADRSAYIRKRLDLESTSDDAAALQSDKG
jgi:hypothetical protein